MCGRFVSTSSAAEIATLFDAVVTAVDVPANFNIAPTTTVYGTAVNSTRNRGPHLIAPVRDAERQ